MRTAALLLALAATAGAQEFEVVSIKLNTSDSHHSGTHSDRGILRADNLTLKTLITMAYQLKDYQIEGPAWIGSERFDIAAKFPEALPRDPERYSAALAVMVRKMLEERFHLVVHRAHKTFAVYALAVEKKGVKIQPSAGCGSSNSNSNDRHYEGSGISMDKFAEWLSRRTDLPVVDRTGLIGCYALALDWVPEVRHESEPKSPTPEFGDTPAGPTLPIALREQLGLQLKNSKAPLEILIVDQAEKLPTEN